MINFRLAASVLFMMLALCFAGCSNPEEEKAKANAALRAEVEEILNTIHIVEKGVLTSVDRGDIINNDWYDKDHSSGFECEYIFHMNAIDTQIICHYSTNSDYNFYQGDEISIQLVDAYQKFEPNGDKEEWADKRTFNMETLDYDKYYEYMYVYQININGNEEVNLNITAKNEMSIEELDKIVQLFIDNIVIINTEG